MDHGCGAAITGSDVDAIKSARIVLTWAHDIQPEYFAHNTRYDTLIWNECQFVVDQRKACSYCGLRARADLANVDEIDNKNQSFVTFDDTASATAAVTKVGRNR